MNVPTGHYKRPSPFERFLKFVEAPDALSCWPWKGSLSAAGYGLLRFDGRSNLAHRLIAAEAYGQIPAGMVVDHLCRNRRCVNPEHLEIVTIGENTRRGFAVDAIKASKAALTHCRRGHPLDGPNLRIDARGHRGCRACQRLKGSEWRRNNYSRVLQMQRERRALGAS